MLVNLLSLKDNKSRDTLVSFLSRTTKDLLDGIPCREKVPYNTDIILLGLDEILMCLAYNEYTPDIYRGHIEAAASWLGEQRSEDTEALIEMLKDPLLTFKDLDFSLYVLYDLLDTSLINDAL